MGKPMISFGKNAKKSKTVKADRKDSKALTGQETENRYGKDFE